MTTSWKEARKRVKELEEMLREEEEKAAARLGKWTPITVREGKKSILVEFMRGPNTPPLRSYRRRSDGTLEIRHNGRPSRMEKADPHNRAQEALYTWVRGEIMEALGRRTGDPSGLIEITHPLRTTTPSLNHELELAAVRAVERATGGEEGLSEVNTKLHWGQAEAPTVWRAADRAARIFAARVVQEETSKLAALYTGTEENPATLTISAYNWAALNRGTIKKLERTAPGFAEYYGRLLRNPEEKPRRMHPGEMVRAVREDTGLDNREWKVFCRIQPDTFITRLNGNPMARMEAVRAAVTGICRAVADANQPRACGSRLREVAYGGGDPAFFHGPDGERGERWRDWVHLLNRYLDPARETVPRGLRTDHEDLSRAVDTLRDHVERGLRWRRGSWEAIMRRSGEWHQAVLRGNWVPKDQMEAAWESPLAAFREGKNTVAPVVTGRALAELGESMGNCLGSYIPDCVRGNVRIFTISRGKKTLAAVEIAREGSAWRTRQVESPFRHEVDPEALELAQGLPTRYTQAEETPRR